MLQVSGWKAESDSVGVGDQIVTLGILLLVIFTIPNVVLSTVQKCPPLSAYLL